MADIIKDGAGAGYSARVTSENRLLVDTIMEPLSAERSRKGFLFGTGTGSVSLKGTVTIHDALQTNFDFIRLCAGNPSFGDAAGAFRADNVSSTSEGYLPILDFRSTFGFKWGLRLKVGSQQKLILRVNDNVTGVDQFDCIAYGFTRSE